MLFKTIYRQQSLLADGAGAIALLFHQKYLTNQYENTGFCFIMEDKRYKPYYRMEVDGYAGTD